MIVHTHGNGKPCAGCFQEYIERNGGLPHAPMDMPTPEEWKQIEEKIRADNSTARSVDS